MDIGFQSSIDATRDNAQTINTDLLTALEWALDFMRNEGFDEDVAFRAVEKHWLMAGTEYWTGVAQHIKDARKIIKRAKESQDV